MLFSKQPKQKQVICIGSTSLDIFFPTDEGVIIDTPDDVLSQKKIAFELGGKVLADEIHTAVGGVAANVAQGLALQGIVASAYT
jgi:sugar/nucleoside kinase (ribokinase family)